MSPKTKAKTRPSAELTFEEASQELERIVGQLEDGQPALEEALALYARGQELAARCQALLQAAELKVQQITPGDGPALTDFTEGDA